MSDALDSEIEQSEDRNLRHLREQAKRGKLADEAIAERDALRRELSVIKSGIDADSPLGKLFLKGYDGDLSDTEGLKSAAVEHGIPFKEGSEPVEPPLEPTGTEERRALAGDGNEVDDGQDHTDPYQKAERVHQSVMESGKPRDDAEAAWVASVAGAAMEGDSRVIYEEKPTIKRSGLFG